MAHLGSSKYVSIGQCDFPFVAKVSPSPYYNFACTCLCVQLKGSSYSTPQPSLFHMDDIKRFVSSKVPSVISDQVCIWSLLMFLRLLIFVKCTRMCLCENFVLADPLYILYVKT
jgi:hypothetical protein